MQPHSKMPREAFLFKQLKILPATPAGHWHCRDVVVRDWFLRAMGGLPSCQCDWVEDSLADLHLKKTDAAPMHLMHIVRRITFSHTSTPAVLQRSIHACHTRRPRR
jgi:hypothetical protein